MYLVISKFTFIAKKARLTPKYFDIIIIGKSMSALKKEVVTKILYNRETVLAYDFIEMRKVKKEVAPLEKIRIVDHKAW